MTTSLTPQFVIVLFVGLLIKLFISTQDLLASPDLNPSAHAELLEHLESMRAVEHENKRELLKSHVKTTLGLLLAAGLGTQALRDLLKLLRPPKTKRCRRLVGFLGFASLSLASGAYGTYSYFDGRFPDARLRFSQDAADGLHAFLGGMSLDEDSGSKLSDAPSRVETFSPNDPRIPELDFLRTETSLNSQPEFEDFAATSLDTWREGVFGYYHGPKRGLDQANKQLWSIFLPLEERPVKGALFLSPGRATSFVQLMQSIYDLREAGFAVISLDRRGIGFSEKTLDEDPERLHIHSFDSYVSDLEDFFVNFAQPYVQERLGADIVFSMLSHSIGSHIALK